MWTAERVTRMAPDEKSIPAAREVLRKGGFGKVEATADGRGWWVVCKGLTGKYQVSVRRDGAARDFDCSCTCPSYKHPCKHALALLLYLVAHPELRVEAKSHGRSTGDFEALLRAVFANPEDDTPRLVFADYLEEAGQADRAALIRVQCEKARTASNSRRGRELENEETRLLGRLRPLIRPLPAGFRVQFERGFIRLAAAEGAFHESGSFPARFADLFRDGWVESVRPRLGYDEFDPGWMELIGQAAELDTSREIWSEEDLVELVAATEKAKATGRLCRVKVHPADRRDYEAILAAHHQPKPESKSRGRRRAGG